MATLVLFIYLFNFGFFRLKPKVSYTVKERINFQWGQERLKAFQFTLAHSQIVQVLPKLLTRESSVFLLTSCLKSNTRNKSDLKFYNISTRLLAMIYLILVYATLVLVQHVDT